MWAIDDISWVIIPWTKCRIQANIWAAHFWTKLQMHPMPFFTAALSLSENAQQIFARRAIYVRKILYLLLKSKFSGEILRCSKSSKCRCNLTFFSVNLFPGGGRLKIYSLCHQNPLWKAHSCNLCRNDAENFPSKPFYWRACFTC